MACFAVVESAEIKEIVAEMRAQTGTRRRDKRAVRAFFR